MLRANVGISRKMSKDYNSQGFTLNLDAEINATLDDAESVIERIKELYSIAEEALDRQISESQSVDALAHRDAEDAPNHPSNGKANVRHPVEAGVVPPSRNGHQDEKPQSGEPANADPATNKQVSFLLTLAKRQRLQGPRLEARIEQVVGRQCSPYDLSKKEAGVVINALNPEAAQDNRSRR